MGELPQSPTSKASFDENSTRLALSIRHIHPSMQLGGNKCEFSLLMLPSYADRVSQHHKDNVAYVLTCIPPAILHWRALIIRDVILAGFELQLYQAEERVFAYWYLAKCLDSHAGVIRELMDVIFECKCSATKMNSV